MQRRASGKPASKSLLSLLLVAFITALAIGALSAMTRYSAAEVTQTESAPQEAAATELTAVIPEDNNMTPILVGAGLAALIIVATGTLLTLKWFGNQKKSARKRKYYPKAEVTFKNLSRRELGVQKR